MLERASLCSPPAFREAGGDSIRQMTGEDIACSNTVRPAQSIADIQPIRSGRRALRPDFRLFSRTKWPVELAERLWTPSHLPEERIFHAYSTNHACGNDQGCGLLSYPTRVVRRHVPDMDVRRRRTSMETDFTGLT